MVGRWIRRLWPLEFDGKLLVDGGGTLVFQDSLLLYLGDPLRPRLVFLGDWPVESG